MLVDYKVLNSKFLVVAMRLILLIEIVLFGLALGGKFGMRQFIEFGAVIMPLSWIEMVWPKVDADKDDAERMKSNKRIVLAFGLVITLLAQLGVLFLAVSNHVFTERENSVLLIGAIVIAAITFVGIQRRKPFEVLKT